MTYKEPTTIEYIRSILEYNKNNGNFVWKKRTPEMFTGSKNRTPEHTCNNWNSVYAGKLAGCLHPEGYIKIRIKNKLYFAHILAWFYEHGVWPNKDVDHIDRNKSNNSIKNLRLATVAENVANSLKRSHNKSGYKGVFYVKSVRKYRAQIKVNKKAISLGYFNTAKEAHLAYCNAANFYYREFACVN